MVDTTLERTITAVAARCLRLATPIDGNTPFHLLGLDSLGTIELAAALEMALGCELPPDVLAGCSDARSLAIRLSRDGVLARNTEDPVEQMLADAALPDDVRPAAPRLATTDLAAAKTILLTGATGFLGGALLEELLRDTCARIICLGRRAPGERDRVLFVEADLTHPRLGLSRGRFESLVSDTDAILHCAATVNWIYSYAHLRAANVLGTLELLRLAAAAGASFHFVSSISACYSTDAPRVVDETYDALPDLRGVHLGYAQSKIVAEALVRAAGVRGVPIRIYRPALISGHSITGSYNQDDVIARLIQGCVRMGTAPDLDWRLDAIPVDVVARAIVRLSGAEGAFHIAHERPRHWRECVLWMRMQGYDVRLVSYPAWLRQLGRDTKDDPEHPLRPLRSFFTDRPTGAGGLTLPELYEESRRPAASGVRTQALLAAAGVTAPPLDAALLDLYFRAFVASGGLPPASSGSPVVQAFSPAFVSSVFPGLEILSSGSDHSIVSELTAWRSRRPTGLFNARMDGEDVILKLKARDTDVVAVGEALADLVDPAVGRAYRRWSDRIGFAESHAREIAIYRQTDTRFTDHAPRVLATVGEDDTWAVVLERIRDARIADSADTRAAWTPPRIGRAIDGLAELQAIWLGREAQLQQQPWIGHVPTTAAMSEMTDLWSALAEHAAPCFSAWGGPELPGIQQRLVSRLGRWWRHLEAGPRTLIHHDFNPRNICLRGADETLCAYDWELATLGAPQRDLAEFLCFVLPVDAAQDDVRPWIERHRRALEREGATAIGAAAWTEGFRAALYDVLVNRLSIYAMVHRVRRQSFLPRVIASWRNLYQLFPLEETT